MKTILMVSIFAVIALASCATPTNTVTNTNTNANSAPKAAAAPTTDALMALETKAWDAWKAKDAKYFEGYIADNMVGFDDKGKHTTKADAVKMIGENKCEVRSYALSDSHMTPIGADAAALTYKVVQDATCDGQKVPATVTAGTVFVRSADAWKAVYHNEVAVIEPKGPAASGDSNKGMPPSPPTADRNANTSSHTNTAGNSNTAANTNPASSSNTAAGGDALTDALMVMEKKGWEAWKAKDGKAFEDTLLKDFAFIDSMGKGTFGKADVIKMWTTDNPCNVSSVSVSDGHGYMITKDASILTFKGAADGTCGTMKLTPLWGTTVSVKEGDVWKAAYIFETPMG